MKKLYLLLFLLIGTISYSQITKSKISSLLKKDKHSYSKVLRTCNTDSLFFKADTIHFYANEYFSVKGCCQYVEWSFYDGNNFNERRTNECNEPPRTFVARPEDFYSIKIEKIKEDFFINKYQNKMLVESYLVLAIDVVYRDKREPVNRLTLVRKEI